MEAGELNLHCIPGNARKDIPKALLLCHNVLKIRHCIASLQLAFRVAEANFLEFYADI